jgi:tripartite-type tricarboxylate transporter receptor subunit TctC
MGIAKRLLALFQPAAMNRDMVAVVAAPATRAWRVSQGVEPVPGTLEELVAFLKTGIAKWGAVVRAAGIRAE